MMQKLPDARSLRERAFRARGMANYICDDKARAALLTFAEELEAQAAELSARDRLAVPMRSPSLVTLPGTTRRATGHGRRSVRRE